VKTLLIAGTALLVTAPAATAQLPTTPQDPPPGQQPGPTTPAPQPAQGDGSWAIASGLSVQGKRYIAARGPVRVRGRTRPYVAGQTIRVELYRGNRRVGARTVPIGRGPGDTGTFTAALHVRRAGNFTLKARHDATPEQESFRLRNKRFTALSGGVGRGSSRARIRVVQKGLRRLAFVTSGGGRFDGALARAVIAFRKTNNMSRTSRVSPKVLRMLLNGRGGYRLKYPKAGKHVEADLSRQVLVLARGGRPERIYHTSTGAPATPTVRGSFRFYRRQPGTNSLGMVHSWYFIRGYAIHGYKSVPTGPASHGCLRVPIPNALSIYRWIDMGDRIFVYR
jgi:hypothetical protein